eukprot:CAMPEP_0119107476 /NCGR_PEP_ID=MMETSP1180-20130426/10405_1 /TAXON_ID=3052 ORGANISM="Chlamydomonas cf sp, Strain CCMP681" /NCGR_SAMPLE_ID=MMETSP1180 /ASSEMBLY_ACC=CAM_ASM_000741 /LENGTH=377 /DNA_ID=CAMNT_0007092971 /DNA_START=1 /DNA_END=1134 /DNA_ORIENTATION=+
MAMSCVMRGYQGVGLQQRQALRGKGSIRAFRRPTRSVASDIVASLVDGLGTSGLASSSLNENDTLKMEDMMRRFKMADTDGNGSIDRTELRMLLESTQNGEAVMFTQHWLPEEELQRVMEQYDKNHDGVIDAEEYKDIVYDGLLLDGMLSEYDQAFRAVDSSSNGTIGGTELAKLFHSLGSPVSYEQLVEIMQKYDKDESGQIEFNEFLLMFRDRLVDLKAVQNYIGSVESREGKGAILEVPEGDLGMVFSQDELDECQQKCAATGKLMVLFLALTWCRPCKGMQRPAQRLAEAYKDSTLWVKCFGNANEQTKSLFKDRLKIRSTPAFVVFRGDQVVYQQTGTNKEKLEAGIREALGGDSAPALAERPYLYPKPVEV